MSQVRKGNFAKKSFQASFWIAVSSLCNFSPSILADREGCNHRPQGENNGTTPIPWSSGSTIGALHGGHATSNKLQLDVGGARESFLLKL